MEKTTSIMQDIMEIRELEQEMLRVDPELQHDDGDIEDEPEGDKWDWQEDDCMNERDL